MKRMLLVAALCVTALAAGAGTAVNAGQVKTGSIPVTLSAIADCKITSAQGTFAFGTLDAINNSPGFIANPQVTLSFLCNKGTSYTIYAGPVSGPAVSLANNGSYSTATGFGGTGYTIKAVSGATGTASASSAALVAVLKGSLNSADPASGTYSDSVVLTVSYS
ncbi:MAG TPA: hypothetical protein VK665_17385 [Candidatus Elarobacter sp.]|nr:hypothetical protein [Candidatus Elarobacter sp.]